MTEEILTRTQLAFDEINALASTQTITEEDIFSLLINSYNLGLRNTSEMLGHPIEVDLDDMEDMIFFMIDDKTWVERFEEYKSNNDTEAIKRLVDTECHRVYGAGSDNGAGQIQKKTGRDIMKKWCTMLDDRVRGTHDYLEGMTVNYTDYFYTYDGDFAKYPSGFQKASNNVNCRCIIEYKMA